MMRNATIATAKTMPMIQARDLAEATADAVAPFPRASRPSRGGCGRPSCEADSLDPIPPT